MERNRHTGSWVAWRRLAAVMILSVGAIENLEGQGAWSLRDSGTEDALGAVVHDGNRFVAVGEAGALATSTDGVLWTSAPPGAVNGSLRGLIWDGARYVACGQNDMLFAQVVTSANAVDWTPASVASQSGSILTALATNGVGVYVACGSGGRVYKTKDPTKWTTYVTVAGAPYLQNIAYGAGRYVAVGAGGTIIHSADAVNWTPAVSGFSEVLQGVTYGNGRWVAVGSAGTILTSIDRVTWTPRVSGTSNYLFSVAYEGGYYVAVGGNGTLLTSPDGITWTPRATGLGADERLASASEGNGQFVVVGEVAGGTGHAAVLTSVSSPPPGFKWTTAAVTATENAGSFTLTINRIGSTDGAAQVQYFLQSGTATVGTDLPDTSPIIEFASGQASKSVEIPLTSDDLFESEEIFLVELRTLTPGWATLRPSTVLVFLRDAQDTDNDGLPDLWEMTHFGGLSATAAGDPDADGNANAVEYTDGTVPTNQNSALYFLTLIAAGNGVVTADPALAKYPRNSGVTLTASPETDWIFESWSGSVSGSISPTTLTMAADLTVTARFRLSLVGALDTPGLTWTTDGTGQPWFGQTATAHDGVDAAQSGVTAATKSTTLSTSLHGPGTLTFNWKCSCRPNSDFLRFLVDGEVQLSRTGVQDWAEASLQIPEGSHLIAWTYSRGALIPAGADAAWLDQVHYDTSATSPFDQWRGVNFTNSELGDPTRSGPGADPDLDGWPNFNEFSFGTSPNSPAAAAPAFPRLEIVSTNDGQRRALVFKRPSSRVGQVIYQGAWSSNLEQWNIFGAEEVIDDNGGTQTVRIVDPLPLNGDAGRFYRVVVTAEGP